MTVPKEIYAHSKTDKEGKLLPESAWQTLEDHEDSVALLAEGYAQESFQSFAIAAAYLHDIGKVSEDFHKRLQGRQIYVDHKTPGAKIALEKYGAKFGQVLAYCIVGHHGGMPDGSDDIMNDLMRTIPKDKAEPFLSKLPDKLRVDPPQWQSQEMRAIYLQLLIRMIFSCLVDADYIDTERFMAPEKALFRKPAAAASVLIEKFEPELNRLFSYDTKIKIVNAVRREVLDACIEKGKMASGFFTLTAPTGSGKTLSSLAFGTMQIAYQNKQRIIYAVPFTTITKQNADVFRGIFGSEHVLEHHSNIDPAPKGKDDDSEETTRLISQNWDAPLVVTTTVQLLESLFSHRPSKCRKVHNMANSVIIFDEAQALPDKYIRPIVAFLKSLVKDFGASVVFCTATQPYMKPAWMSELDPIEIIPDKTRLFDALKRVEIKNLGTFSDESLINHLSDKNQAMAIVNTRAHARSLFKRLENHRSGVYHLSKLMCQQHISDVLDEIKKKLEGGHPCIVVSTPLIEAGIDIDFPFVYRAAAGLENIAQSAGRCNREGELTGLGSFFIFTPEDVKLPSWLSENEEFAREVMDTYEDILSPEAIEYYFSLRFNDERRLDRDEILQNLTDGYRDLSFPFRSIGENFHMIEDGSYSVIIPYDDIALELLKDPLANLRRLQRYTVSVFSLDGLEGQVDKVVDEVYRLSVSDAQFELTYNRKTGLEVNPELTFLHY
jgi:CRISPR-associated helicase Cas3/CRISPR-associated endonuclease Cas3-HD